MKLDSLIGIDPPNFSEKGLALEHEVIFLRVTIELIDAMVNFEVLDIDRNGEFSEVRFKAPTHHKYFGILLVDFLSKIHKDSLIGEKPSHVDALKAVCSAPGFQNPGSADQLKFAVQELSAWLDQEVSVAVWLPSLSAESTLTIERQRFLWMCGNVSKHNLLNLSRVAAKLKKHLNASGLAADESDALLALEDFYTRFHDDILLYHSSRIVELLNNVRWGIHTYLRAEYERSYVPGTDPGQPYRFIYPNAITSSFARECYWALMNSARAQPFFPHFKAHEILLRRY